ncbi:MAG: 30S ribosome-binding factor RbfA [Desulfobulbaceae bacterium]|uniref:Ribosome-binding factor A n=1 Tax=Candidatus Desulfobia pelagia TaxID=2841692 RepID=A0A8J6TFS9_9BACT|nr:30S ribosome-binding factor RbfA [Candidatus Desulfobia pelagia]
MVRKAKTRFGLPAGLDEGPRRRPARVGDLIMQEIATLILYKIKDPALFAVTILQVKVTDDLKKARVLFTCPDDVISKSEKGLKRARGFIRSHLASQLQLRYAPELFFEYDSSVAEQEKMNRLFKEIAGEHE